MISNKYQNIYEKFVESYKKIHIDPWHEINEETLNNLHDELASSMDITDSYTFIYFMDYIIKRLNGKSDAHTKLDMVSILPINFKIFDDEALVNYPEELKGASLKSINGISIKQIISEIDDIISFGTEGKRRFETEKALFNKYVMFGLPSLRETSKLIYEFTNLNGETVTKTFNRKKSDEEGKLFDYEKYLYGDTGSYKITNNVLIYNHSSVQSQYETKIKDAIKRLEAEDLSQISTIIIDLRGNTGGNSGLNSLLTDFLNKHTDKKLICLTDYRIFSAGRYALADLIKLGAITIGEGISTPINCFDESNWVLFDEYSFSISGCYFNPFIHYTARTKEKLLETKTSELLKPYIFEPDINVSQNKSDYINGIDTVLNYALYFCKEKQNEL
mgnify:FL=1